jgi:hypothetical protein
VVSDRVGDGVERDGAIEKLHNCELVNCTSCSQLIG